MKRRKKIELGCAVALWGLMCTGCRKDLCYNHDEPLSFRSGCLPNFHGTVNGSVPMDMSGSATGLPTGT